MRCEGVIFASSNSPRLLQDVLAREAWCCFAPEWSTILTPGQNRGAWQWWGVAWGCSWLLAVWTGVLLLSCTSGVDRKGGRRGCCFG